MAERTVRLQTTGMHCQSCSMLIQMNVGDLEGVHAVVSDYASGITEVTFDPEVVSVEDVVAEVEKAGYGAEVAG